LIEQEIHMHTMNAMNAMNAVVFRTAGVPAEVLRMEALPIPEPQVGEVLVHMEASPVQPADLLFIAGRYRIQPQPTQVAGLEGCGTVVTCGPGAAMTPGTRVAFRHPGCWAEYTCVPADKVCIVPEGVPADAASQFSLNPLTAWALLEECDARTGDSIAVNAAGSAVAALVRALAHRRGVRVVGIHRRLPAGSDGSPEVSSETPDLAAELRQAGNGQPLEALLDCVGGEAVMRVLPALAVGATIVSYGVLEREPAGMRNADLIYRNLTWKGFGIDHWLAKQAGGLGEVQRQLWAAWRDGALPLPVRSRHSLANFRQALEEAALPGAGKVLLAAAAAAATVA